MSRIVSIFYNFCLQACYYDDARCLKHHRNIFEICCKHLIGEVTNFSPHKYQAICCLNFTDSFSTPYIELYLFFVLAALITSARYILSVWMKTPSWRRRPWPHTQAICHAVHLQALTIRWDAYTCWCTNVFNSFENDLVLLTLLLLLDRSSMCHRVHVFIRWPFLVHY